MLKAFKWLGGSQLWWAIITLSHRSQLWGAHKVWFGYWSWGNRAIICLIYKVLGSIPDPSMGSNSLIVLVNYRRNNPI